MPREHGESGEFVETTTLDDVLGVLDAVDGPVVLSADVADHLGVSRETARRKLKALYDRGDLDRRKVARRVVYWRPEESAESGRGPVDTPTAGQADRTDPPTTSPATRGQDAGEIDATDADTGDPIGEALTGWEPDAEADAKPARAQTRRAAEYLREHAPERFKRSELQDALAAGSSWERRHWWERAVQPGLRHLADHGLVEFRDGHYDYLWVGDGEES